jgi:hypothetical protein
VSTLLSGLAALLGTTALLCAASALPPLFRAFGAGLPWWYGGIGWFGGQSRHMPEAAQPHARKAMQRWLAAMALLVLAGVAGIAAQGLE